MAEITVLMAAYNTEQYLGRALDSILAQTFQDFEIRIIDDGSTDSTGTIADGYARADSRLHVRHQSNMGTCTTKNNLLDWTYAESGSRWLLFFDSDDWAHPEMLERLLNAAVEHKVRISACGYEETAGDDPVVRPEDLQPVLWDPMEFYKTHFINASMACCKLYHRDCYEYIRHPKKGYFDDEFVCYRLLFQEPQMAVIPAPLYAYFINPKGVTKRSWTPRMLEAWVAYEEQIAFFKEKGRQDLVYFRYRSYLDNALANREKARQADDSPEIRAARKKIDQSIKRLLRRMWHEDAIRFWIDYDILYAFYPFQTRLYRLGLEVKSRMRGDSHG